jgi:hypothetical protein
MKASSYTRHATSYLYHPESWMQLKRYAKICLMPEACSLKP